MFNRQEGLNQLGRVFNGSDDLLTIRGLMSLWNEDVLTAIKEEHGENAEEYLSSRFSYKPNLTKTYVNEDWVKYSVTFYKEVYRLGYVNRKDKKVVLDTREDSAFKRIKYSLEVVIDVHDGLRDDVDITELDDFSVTTTERVAQDYKEMKTRSVDLFVQEHREKIVLLVDTYTQERIEKEMMNKFVKDILNIEDEGYESYINSSYNPSNKIMSLETTLSESMLFDYVENKEVFELIYRELLYKNFFDQERDVNFNRLTNRLYEEMIIEKKRKEFENNYTLLLSREIVKVLPQGGKTLTIKSLSTGHSMKVANDYGISMYSGKRGVVSIGDGYRSNTCYSDDVEFIKFGKKVLFNRAEFDKTYGHLKSEN